MVLNSVASICFGQTVNFDLRNASAVSFNKSTYVYGFMPKLSTLTLCVYRLDKNHQKKDSFSVEFPNSKAEDFLRNQADTLHDFLNIYVQKKDKSISILRFNKQFNLIAKIEDVEVARLNNSAMFKNSPLYFKNNVFAVHIAYDSTGQQFYINKFELKSELKNFEYEFKWQFPFERKNIHSAQLFFADQRFVFVYVIVRDGTKAGEWILKLNTMDGKLIKATKLNDQTDNDSYLFGSFSYDQRQKSLVLIGQKFSNVQLNLKTAKLNIANLPVATVYYVEIDSLGEIIKRQDFKVPINNIVSGAKNQSNGYVLNPYSISKDILGNVSFYADVYKSTGQALCFGYSNSVALKLIKLEDKLVMEKCVISPNALIETYYFSKDKLDENGRLCVSSASEIEKLFLASPGLLVKINFKIDEEKNSHWLLTKSNPKKNSVNFSVLAPDKKIYQVKSLDDYTKSSQPGILSVSQNAMVIFSQTEETKFQLKTYNW